ncbi:hypothetical protein J3R83DRAFT_13743 [Lanmaoa asiatica]|nr:hypothetical protein J3R83DRAFT_13743 [Lanmaoa asiatica]
MFSPSRYSYTSSDTPLASSDSEGATSDRRMRRVNVSPSRSGTSHDSYAEENSVEERAEVEAALNNLDNEFDDTEDMLTEWSRGSGPSSYTGTTPSYSTSLDTYSIYNREGNRLSTISERTENIPSRPISYLRDGARSANPTPEGPRLSAHRISTASPGHFHSRSVTDLTSDRPIGRRTGDLIAFFEDRASPSDTSFGHSRTSSMPGNRAHSPFFPHSQSTPYMSSTTGYGYTTTGYGTSSGYGSRPSSPTKSKAGSAISSATFASDALSSSSLLAPPTRNPTTTTSRSGTQLSPSDFTNTFANTFAEARSATTSSAISPTVSPLRRPQTSPRSPLTSVRNIVAAWKERTPALGKTAQSSTTESSISPVVKPFGLRRRASRAEKGQQPTSENTSSSHNPPTTPKSTNSNIIPPPFDMTDSGAYARDSREPLRIGDLWYLNVHSGPPYRWQRCEALLYPHMLLLSWIARGGGRGVVTLDLLNCTEVRSVPSPSHPSAKEDVGTIAARAQIAEGDSPPLMELLCPFQLLYSDGVERLAAESARVRVRWVSAIWEALDRSITLPSRSEPGSPTGSIRTIRSMTSTASVSGAGSGSGSASTVFVPPLHTIPSLSDLHTLSDSSSTGSLSRAPSFHPHHTRTTDDAAVSNQSYLYPGDPRVIAPSRSSSLRRTSSLTDLDEEFASAVSRARNAKPGLGFGLSLVGGVILGDGSPVTVSSGPRLGGEVRVTPPPSGKTKARPLSDVSDDNFFSAGSRTSSSEPRTTTNSFYTMSDSSTSSSDARPTTTDIITDETAFEFTSGGSNTQIVPSTLSYRRTESNSYLGDSHDGSYTYSSYTSTSPSSLSRSPGIRRRRYSRNYVSDKENAASGYTASQSRSTLSTWTRSRSTTPTPAPSTAALSALEIPDGSGSEGYETANSPSTASFKSLPSIPSETDYATVEQCKTEASTEFHTVDRCASDLSSEYVTAEKCKTETETEFVTAALCECERTEQSETHYETASLCNTIPSEASTPRSLAIDLSVERAPTPPPKTPPVTPSLQSSESDILPDITPEFVPLPPSELSPTASSASRDLESEHLEVTVVPPSSSIVSSGELSISLPSTDSSSEDESSRIPTVSNSDSSELVMGDVPVSEESLPSPAPLATTESSSPSIHPSQWASETDVSYESSQLQPTPLTQSLQFQDGRDTSFETSFMRPSVSPLTSFGSLTAMTETITTSVVSTPLPPPPPAPVTQIVSSPSSGPTPLSITSTASSSLSRTPSTVSSISSISTRISPAEDDVVSLADVPAPSEVSTEPSLLSSLRSSSISSVHYYPHPTMVPLPESPAPVYSPDHSPAPSPSLSLSTPQTNQPSIRSELETEPTRTHTERTEGSGVSRNLRNVRIIRDELYDLSEYVRTRLVATERVIVAERPEPPTVPHRDQSVGAMSFVSEPRAAPAGPRSRPGLIPITLTPPPVRSPSISSTSSSVSFLSSHHSDDFSLLGVDEVEVEIPPRSPAWLSETSSPSSDLTPSIISSSESSPGPTLSLTSSSSSPTPPPSSPTPSTESSDSSDTARPVEGITMTIIRDMLTQMLDELRQSRSAPQDNTELLERLHHIETLIETVINTQRATGPRGALEETETIQVSDTTQRVTTHRVDGSVTESEDSQADADSLLSRWRDMVRARERGRFPIHMPAPRQAGLSLDEQLMELLNVPPAPVPSDIQPPPQLIPFIYQPAPRPSRSRSTSPVPRGDSAPPFRQQSIWSPITLHRPLQHPPRTRPPLSRPGRQTRAGEPASHETPPVIPGSIPPRSRPPRPEYVARDPPPPQLEPLPERRPEVRPPGPFLPDSLYDRSPTAPPNLGGVDPPHGSFSWYRRRPEGGVVPPPGVIGGQPRQPGDQAQGPAYVPMPPGPTVVQLPLFDTLMAILREHRLAQLATVDQQRELMRYMSGLNDWLARDVQDRQAELRAVTARVDELRADLGRLGVGPGLGIPMPQPQTGRPEPVNLGQGAGGFIVPPLPPGPGGPVPPVVPGQYPAGFVPQPGAQVPVIPVIGGSPDIHSPVIPEPPTGWGIRMPEPTQYVGPMGPVLPQAPYEDYPPSGPSVYVHHGETEHEGPVIPSPPSSESRSPLPVPGRGTIIIPPSHTGHDSLSSTPTQESYLPPPSPGALPIPPSDVPAVVPVAPSVGSPPPQQTIINLPQAPVPPPGHIVQPIDRSEPLVVHPGQAGVPMQPGIPVHPSITVQQPAVPVQPTPFIIHPPVPVEGSVYGRSRASSRTSTRPPVVVVQSSQDRSPLLVHGDRIPISPTIHAVPVTSIGGSRPYSPEGRYAHEVSRSPPHDVSRSPSRRLRRRRPDDDRRSRSYSPDDRGRHGRYYSPEYDDDDDDPEARRRRRHGDDEDDPETRHRRRHDDDDEPEARRRRRHDDDEDDPEARHRRRHDDDDEPEARRRRRHGDDEDDPEARHRRRHDDDDEPEARRRRRHGDDDDPEARQRYRDPDDYSPRRGDRGGRDRPGTEREYSPEDPGRHSPRRRPSGRSDYRPETGEHDRGDRTRAPPSEPRSTHRPEPAGGDTSGALPHPPPASPAPPTIIRLGGDPRAREPYFPTMPSERGGHDRRPSVSREEAPEGPRRHPSSASATGGDRHTPQRALSRGAPTPMIAEEDEGRPPSDVVHHVPAPGQPPAGPGDSEFENDLRARQERLDDAERQLTHMVHDAQDAEGKREQEFRDNEDARERIFLDNEDRRDAETRQRGDALFHELEEKIANVPPMSPISPAPVRPHSPDHASILESIHTATQDAASRHASDILDTVRMEREEMARERESLAAERERERARLDEERRLLDEEREAKIAALEDELARTRAELDNERQLRMTEADEARMAAAERDEALRNQLADLTNMIQQNQALCEEKKALMDERWAEKQRWKEERDGQMHELMGMVSRLVDEQAAAKQREEEERQANEGKPGIEQVLEELQRQNAEQRGLLDALSDSWRADSNRQHQETISAVRATANEQVPYNVQGYLDEFSKALATEVRMLLGEVGKLREERRNIQHELGYLMMMKSKYGPGGEFDPEWFVVLFSFSLAVAHEHSRKPPMAPGPAPPPPPAPDVPPPPEDIQPIRPAWRTVPQRSSRRIRKRQDAPPPEPVPEPRQVHSWVTWQPNPALAPTPPSVEPTLLVPDRGSPGLFGPRSPRDSFRG